MSDLEKAFEVVMLKLGLDLSDPNLSGTPKRLAKMYRDELFIGTTTTRPEIKSFPKGSGQSWLHTRVPFKTMCAHHFQPITGDVDIFVDYSNSSEVVGLSKFNRLVNWVGARPTIQEDFNSCLLVNLLDILPMASFVVSSKASHNCVTGRGVCAAYSSTTVVNFSENCDPSFKDFALRKL